MLWSNDYERLVAIAFARRHAWRSIYLSVHCLLVIVPLFSRNTESNWVINWRVGERMKRHGREKFDNANMSHNTEECKQHYVEGHRLFYSIWFFFVCFSAVSKLSVFEIACRWASYIGARIVPSRVWEMHCCVLPFFLLFYSWLNHTPWCVLLLLLLSLGTQFAVRRRH